MGYPLLLRQGKRRKKKRKGKLYPEEGDVMCHQWRFAFIRLLWRRHPPKCPWRLYVFFLASISRSFDICIPHYQDKENGVLSWPRLVQQFSHLDHHRGSFSYARNVAFFDYYRKIELRILLLWWSIGRGDHLSCWKQMNPKLWMKGDGLLIVGSGRHYWAAAFYKRNLGQSWCDGCEMTTPAVARKDRPLVDFIRYKCLLVLMSLFAALACCWERT